MKHLNDHLLTQIVILQNTRVPPPSLESPNSAKARSGKQSYSRRRRRAASPTLSEQSNDESSSPHPDMKNQPDQSRRRTEAFICVQDLDELIQERVEEASMPHNRKFRVIAIDESNSLFSEALLEYKFPKKFVIPTFDCYFGQSDPVQHLCQYQDKMLIHFRSDSILCRILPPT